jgi:murein DD-endopeptidase MepM/ murein hydrolase activator NlpD
VTLDQRTEQAVQALQRVARRHRRALVASAVVLLAGFGITAVATVAIAPLVPEPALLPQRLVTEAIEPQGLAGQLEALAAQELTLTRSDVTRSTDSPEALLARLGVVDASAAAFLRTDSTARLLLAGRGGKMVQAHMAADGTLAELIGRYPSERSEQSKTDFTRLTLSRVDGRWQARLETAPLNTQMRLASGTIRSSLYAATDEAGIPDAVAAQIAEIFSTDIDFHRELRKGDTFHLVYETLTADGEPVTWNEGAGRVLAAEFVNGKARHQALWFSGSDGRGGYYTPDGQSKRRSFLASPMAFSRMTSGFAMRMHPLLNTWRKHNGVDYAAPTGTPVRSVGDGTVVFAGRQNGYGNVVELQHGQGRTTLYAHLSRIDVRKGQHVEQGQNIGAVGATGWATGPHLHFEFRVNGVHQDPLRIAKASEAVALDAGSRPRFEQTLRVVQAKLEVAESLDGTRATVE